MARKTTTLVEGLPVGARDDFEGFEVIDGPVYSCADDVPRSVRLLIAQASVLRSVPAAELARLYDMPIAWVDRFIAEATKDDLACELTAHGVTLGRPIQ
jgi:hypothetical protein